ncbi:hypothetical protein [Adhaeribacter rhizoryzae]|uniref:Uncharacterized protein n=1 Tax=Adhaeribacter rhizoryzae TaxID=2607907 RepID=A0A5M6DPL3_9BACT|nr:hypothetical protein [Adhaeribacter rhizoryzae]KAA5549447.1 hypothetical protein F0145_02335 [Adhaeribacter rhizoryzae]
MEAKALYELFEQNLNIILEVLRGDVEIQRTPFQTSLPLEIKILCTVLNTTGENFGVKADDLNAVSEFHDLYVHQKDHASRAMQKILNDKRSYMKTPEGTVLVKELLIRRLEYFNEAARVLNVMATQKTLGSPLQYNYTGTKK